ncbi:IS5/IS1182 family transposase, partial [Streptomyces sp. NPDC005373]
GFLARERPPAGHCCLRSVARGSRLGKVRWAVERPFAWLHWSKRPGIRYGRRANLRQG